MMFEQLNPPNLTDLLDKTKASVKAMINCIQIGQIVAYNPDNQLATIKLSLKQINSINADGTREVLDYPLLAMCPVMTLYGGQSFISLPIQAGDNCIVLFNDRQIDNWVNSGEGQIPNSTRTHDLSDGIAIVGIKNLTNAFKNIVAGIIQIYFDANTNINISSDLIQSMAASFFHQGDMTVSGGLAIGGNVTSYGGSTLNFNANINQQSGYTLSAGNGATGTFSTVTVQNGIVVSGI